MVLLIGIIDTYSISEFCSTIAKKDDNMSSSDESTSGLMPTEESDEQPFINHPFQIKESNAAIKMNIRVSLAQC